MKAKDIEAVEFVLLEQLKKHISCEFLDKAMPKITLLGSGGALWIASAGAMFVSKRYRNTACTLGAGLITGSVVCNALLKKLIKRPRPCWIRVPDGMLIEIPRDYSFPSGHTMSSFLAATIIAHANRELGMAHMVWHLQLHFQDCISMYTSPLIFSLESDLASGLASSAVPFQTMQQKSAQHCAEGIGHNLFQYCTNAQKSGTEDL